MKLKIVGLITFLLFLGCGKQPLEDGLEHLWKLEKYTLEENGETIICHQLFFSITRMVTEVSEKQTSNGHKDGQELRGYGAFIARTKYRENSSILVLEDFKIRTFNSDSKVDATKEQLLPFGINNPKETLFNVVFLSSHKLVLKSEYARLVLTKN